MTLPSLILIIQKIPEIFPINKFREWRDSSDYFYWSGELKGKKGTGK